MEGLSGRATKKITLVFVAASLSMNVCMKDKSADVAVKKEEDEVEVPAAEGHQDDEFVSDSHQALVNIHFSIVI